MRPYLLEAGNFREALKGEVSRIYQPDEKVALG
jgi:hypothetical protein